MASAEQLKRIAQLADRLDGVADKRRGLPIEAEDWNTLVAVLREILAIERVQEDVTGTRLDTQYAPANHTHLGAVSREWLDADLQKALTSSGSGVSVLTGLADLRDRLAGVGRDLARLDTAVDTQQKTVDRFAVNDAERAGALTRFDGRLAAVDGLRVSVESVSAEMGAVRKNVDEVLELRSSLLDAAGNRIDLGAIKAQVDDLQSIRENLKGLSGQPLRLRDLELRLNEIGDAAGVSGTNGLDARFAGFSTELNAKVTEQVNAGVTGLRGELTAARAEDTAARRAELNATIQSTSTSFQSKIDGASAASRADTAAQLDAALRKERQQTRTETSDQIAATRTQITADVDQRITSAVTAARTTLETSLRASLTQSFKADLAAQGTAFDAKLTQGLADAATVLGRQVSDAEARITAGVTASVSEATTTIRTEVNGLIASTRTSLSGQVAQQVATAMRDATPGFTATIQNAVSAQLADLDTRIGRAVDAATASLPTTIASAVQLELARADIGGQIAASVNEATSGLRRELQAGLSQVQQNQTAAINAAVAGLRGEISAAVANGVTSAVGQSRDMVTALRQETSSAIEASNTRISDLDTRVTRGTSTTTPTTTPGGTRVPPIVITRPNG